MITRIELIKVLVPGWFENQEIGAYRRMILNFLRMDDYEFVDYYEFKVGQRLSIIRKNLYF